MEPKTDKKLQVGQTVWVENIRRYEPIVETTISMVGRKWFRVFHFHGTEFSVENGSHKPNNYSPVYKAWVSKTEYDEYQQERTDRRDLEIVLRGNGKLPISKVRAILAILTAE